LRRIHLYSCKKYKEEKVQKRGGSTGGMQCNFQDNNKNTPPKPLLRRKEEKEQIPLHFTDNNSFLGLLTPVDN